jgi:hypothetical protein
MGKYNQLKIEKCDTAPNTLPKNCSKLLEGHVKSFISLAQAEPRLPYKTSQGCHPIATLSPQVGPANRLMVLEGFSLGFTFFAILFLFFGTVKNQLYPKQLRLLNKKQYARGFSYRSSVLL